MQAVAREVQDELDAAALVQVLLSLSLPPSLCLCLSVSVFLSLSLSHFLSRSLSFSPLLVHLLLNPEL